MNDDASSTGDPRPGTPEPAPVTDVSATEPPPPAATTEASAPTPEPVPSAPATPPAPTPEPVPVQAPAPVARSNVSTQNRIALVGTVALLVALVAGGAFLLGRGTGGGTDDPVGGIAASPTPAGPTVDPSAAVPTPLASDPYAGIPADGNRLGRPDAKVVVEYWADYQCPYCGTFGLERIPDLLPLVADGTIALVHRDYAFIGPESMDAAVAVRCAGREDRYWPMHDAVYAAQDGENQGAFARDRLVAIGESVGVAAETIEACFDDQELVLDVLADNAAAVRSAIQSTPTIDVNGTRFLGVPAEGEIEQAVAEAIAGASPKPAPTQAPVRDPWAEVGATGRSAGPEDAPVTVDVWLDYQAPESRGYAGAFAEQLRARIADGKARVAIHDLALLGDESVVAATALRCIDAQDGPTMLIAEVLAAAAQGADTGVFTPVNLLRLGSQLGVDVRAMDACLADDATAAEVRDETAAGRELGLETAPAIVVSRDGREVERFTGEIDAERVLAAIDGDG